MDCVAPGVSVSGHVRPLQAVYVTHIERLLEAVFVAFLKCPSVTMASGEFAIKDHLRQAVVLHSGYVTSPLELSYFSSFFNAGDFSLFKDLDIRDEFAPVDVKDSAKAALVETLKK